MRNLALSSLLLLLAVVPVQLGAQVIEGRVVAFETEEPLQGALVFLLDREDQRVATALSDSAGTFRLAPPSAGAWILGAELLGHGTVRSDTLDAAEGETVTVEVRMSIEPVEIEEPVVVVAEARIAPDLLEFWERVERGERTGFGHFIYGEDLERPTPYASDLLRMVPGVRVVSSQYGQTVLMRGGCVPAIYIDGTRINRLSRLDSFDQYVVVGDIEGIEVYRGAHQPGGRFIDRNGCGLVLVWTKRGTPDPSGTLSWKRLAVGAALILGILLMR